MNETGDALAKPLTGTNRFLHGFVGFFTTAFFFLAVSIAADRDFLHLVGLDWRQADRLAAVLSVANGAACGLWVFGTIVLTSLRLWRRRTSDDPRDPVRRLAAWVQAPRVQRPLLVACGATTAITIALVVLGTKEGFDADFYVLGEVVAITGVYGVAGILRLLRRKSVLGSRVEIGAPNAIAHGMPAVLVLVTVAVGVAFTQVDLNGFAFELLVLFYILTLLAGLAVGSFIPDAEVGADGIYVRGPFARFVPFVGTETVRRFAWGMTVRREGKLLLRLRVRDRGDIARQSEIVTRIEAAVLQARSRAETTVIALEAHAARNAGDPHEGGYRVASGMRDELWQLVEGTNVPAEVRLEAARELAKDASPSDEERLRAAAEASAEPEIRETLLQAVNRA